MSVAAHIVAFVLEAPLIVIVFDSDAVLLFPSLMESTFRFGSCYLHQSRFLCRSLCYIDDNAFLGTPAAVMVVVVVVVAVIAAVPADFYAQGNYVAR